METTSRDRGFGELQAVVGGGVYLPGSDGYAEGTSAFNLNGHQEPAVVVMAEGTDDIAAAVRYAAAEGLGVGVLATGHGVALACDGGVLVSTKRMRDVHVDPEARTATVGAGALWSDVIPAAQEHGLMGLCGSTSGVGVVGYTVGGGFGWLGRKHGYAANRLIGAEVVTADGEVVGASADDNPELFRGTKGGAGNFGIISSMTFSLVPLTEVFGGTAFYPVSRAKELLELYARWSGEMPDEMSSGIAFMNIPPLPSVPEPLRGGSFISLRACYCGDDLQRGEELLAPWLGREDVVLSNIGRLPCAAMDAISMDPTDPIGAYGHMELLDEITPEVIETLVEVAGEGSGAPIIMLELRQLGGAIARTPASLNPMGSSPSGRDPGYILNAIGANPTPEVGEAVLEYLAALARNLKPYGTGATYVNFLDLQAATAERVRASYSEKDWRRLVALKDEYDPDNVFRFNRNIPPSEKQRSG